MKRVIIWGTKFKALRLLHYLDYSCTEIVAFTDKDCQKKDKFLDRFPLLPKYEALLLKFDYIIIASQAYCEISGLLLSLGIQEERIVQAYNANYMIPDTLFYFNEIDKHEDKLKLFTSIDCLVSMEV